MGAGLWGVGAVGCTCGEHAAVGASATLYVGSPVHDSVVDRTICYSRSTHLPKEVDQPPPLTLTLQNEVYDSSSGIVVIIRHRHRRRRHHHHCHLYHRSVLS